MKTNSLTTKSDAIPSSLLSLYESYSGAHPVNYSLITGSASSRKYFRIVAPDASTVIGVTGNIKAENNAFLYIEEKLREPGIHMPAVLAVSADRMSYILEDLGDSSLYEIIKTEGFSRRVIDLCKQSIDQLIEFQVTGASSIDTAKCFPVPAMEGDSIIWDLHYFKYCFAKLYVPELDEIALEHDFKLLYNNISNTTPQLLIHRDFQSRNIMIKDNIPYIIDFQGARRGPAVYDIVSFLWQARIAWPTDVKKGLIDYYVQRLAETTGCNHEDIKATLPSIVAFRMMQVLGAYGFRGLIQHNTNFTKHIPIALASLSEAINSTGYQYQYLSTLVSQITTKIALESAASTNGSIQEIPSTLNMPDTQSPTLTVTVTSFSYKKGMPIDESGNGGGFVFDCRAIHNPGRYEQYKQLTGNDRPVIEFLENDGEITTFLTHCKALVDQSVERYIKRGFTNLSVAFGCTGGQHRSVYSATHMAHYLAQKYNIRVILNHREQGILENL